MNFILTFGKRNIGDRFPLVNIFAYLHTIIQNRKVHCSNKKQRKNSISISTELSKQVVVWNLSCIIPVSARHRSVYRELSRSRSGAIFINFQGFRTRKFSPFARLTLRRALLRPLVQFYIQYNIYLYWLRVSVVVFFLQALNTS